MTRRKSTRHERSSRPARQVNPQHIDTRALKRALAVLEREFQRQDRLVKAVVQALIAGGGRFAVPRSTRAGVTVEASRELVDLALAARRFNGDLAAIRRRLGRSQGVAR